MTEYTETLSFPTWHHLITSSYQDITAPLAACLSPASRWEEKLHHPPALRASVELGRPPNTHDCRLGSPINADTGVHTDSIMAKHRKDRDSWGECTYNISYFLRALTCRSVFLQNTVEARTLHKFMFISSSTTNSSVAFRYVRGKCVFISNPMWSVGREITRFFICFVCYRGPVMQKRADIKSNKNTFWKMFLISTQTGRFWFLHKKASNTPLVLFWSLSITGALWCICHPIM